MISTCPQLPFVPQLGAVMLAEACRPLRGVHTRTDGSGIDVIGPLAVNDVVPLETLTALVAIVPEATPVKLQVAGPVTLTVALTRAGVDEPVARSLAAEAARRSLAAMADTMTGRCAVVFLDEPALVQAWSEDALDDLAASVASAREFGFVVGVHVCGNGDVATAVAAEPDIVGVTLGNAERSRDSLVEHFDRGGWIAWGAGGAPWESLRAAMAAVGAPDVVAGRSLITPECGLAGFDEEGAVAMLDAVAALGERIAALAVTPPEEAVTPPQ